MNSIAVQCFIGCEWLSVCFIVAAVWKKRQTDHSKATDVIRKVIKQCDEEANESIALGDYHGQMNSINFEKCVSKKKLLPNCPRHSVIILGNTPYQYIQDNKPPTNYTGKKTASPALNRWKKFELLDLIEKHKNPMTVYRIDKVLKNHRHTVFCFPLFMCVLNREELAWAKLKRVVKENNWWDVSHLWGSYWKCSSVWLRRI